MSFSEARRELMIRDWLEAPWNEYFLTPKDAAINDADGSEEHSMEVVYFTLVAILLYLVADRTLRGIESAVGRTLEYRSVVFFAILLVLAMGTFALIQSLGR